ncbi:BRISC complex subunit Abraxas 2-like [Haliotis rufescens]|uniref:BRISC complex subunit Abraxas 2-like n=1 Tax=Haliotis rufescens TaxID=6454 RepID=UPI00201F5F5D|nr:BRISC complex subunit Abraxas 2-like [Haliotis rufescens]
MAASVSGTVLSSLFYDQINSPGDQEGYLLGKIVNHVQDKISDSQISNCKVETVIYVYSYLPWPNEDRLYNSAGRVDPTKAMTLLQGKHQDLIGWYKFRRNSTLRPSLRETNLHRNLIESLPVQENSNFLFLLCSTSLSYNKATHTFDHALLRNHNGKFQKVAMRVINLGDTTHTEYKTRGNLTVNPQGGSLTTVINQFQGEFVSGSGAMLEINKIQGMSTSLHTRLQGLSQEVEKSEESLSTLEEEVKLMSYRLLEQEEKMKAERKAAQKPPSPTPAEVVSPVSPVAAQAFKLNTGRSEHRLRVSISETSRRPRQISIEDDETDRPEATKRSPEICLLDLEEKEQEIRVDSAILQPFNNDSMDVDASRGQVQRTRSRKAKSDGADESAQLETPQQGQTQASTGETTKKDSDSGQSKDAFSFVNNILEKEIEQVEPSTSKPGSHEVGKPTVKREASLNTNSSNVTVARRPHSRAEAQAARSRKAEMGETSGSTARVGSPSPRIRQPAKTTTVTGASAAEVKGERSRPQRVRSRPGQGVRARSRESPSGSQRLGTSIPNVTRTKSASPSHCRAPARKTTCENGTDSGSVLDDSKVSSSPVF